MSNEPYIPENAAFPGSATAVETAVPAFIGYTFKAERNGKSLIRVASRISSFGEYVGLFGGGHKTRFGVEAATGQEHERAIISGGAKLRVKLMDENRPWLYDSIRLFYLNGGGPCYILPLGVYGDSGHFAIDPKDFNSSAESPLQLLEKEAEVTLILIPDAAALPRKEAYGLYQNVLAHCAKMQNRFAIFDLPYPKHGESNAELFEHFRGGIGTDHLKSGAAYYPWLNTSVVQPDEIDFENIDPAISLTEILPESGIKELMADYHSRKTSLELIVSESHPDPLNRPTGDSSEFMEATAEKLQNLKISFHQALRSASPVYVKLTDEIRHHLNQLPAGGAIAGMYTAVDSSRGVWKSPANVSLNGVSSPVRAVSEAEQENMTVNLSGKSINAIRAFPGAGCLVWGGRTLDGNSLDWRYINVCRTLIMIRESAKLAVRRYIFEPNDANTWVTVRSMLNNFLFLQWKLGALAGATPEEAYDVQVGLGSTMTATDILDGRLLISLKLAVSKPAEFIVITFEQQLQQS